jgi:ArsR family transcriptional regulator
MKPCAETGAENASPAAQDAVDRARELIARSPVYRLSEVFRVLGDPTRVGILIALTGGEMCVCDLAKLFEITPGAVCHHLAKLKTMRLVRPRREGRMVFHRLDDEHVERLFAEALSHVGEPRRWR